MKLFIILSIILSGCALKYTDNYGNENVLGCVWIKQNIDTDPVIVQLKTLGVGLNVGSENNGINVGYSNLIKVSPRVENAIYKINYNTLTPFDVVLEEKIYNND